MSQDNGDTPGKKQVVSPVEQAYLGKSGKGIDLDALGNQGGLGEEVARKALEREARELSKRDIKHSDTDSIVDTGTTTSSPVDSPKEITPTSSPLDSPKVTPTMTRVASKGGFNLGGSSNPGAQFKALEEAQLRARKEREAAAAAEALKKKNIEATTPVKADPDSGKKKGGSSRRGFFS